MSKKNNLATRNRQHQFDLAREKKAAEERSKALNKKELKTASRGGVKKVKVKSVRIRKGVHIKGIKVVDADTKKKVMKIIKADAESRTMQVEQTGQQARKAGLLKPIKKKLKVNGAAASAARKAATAAAAEDRMMQD